MIRRRGRGALLLAVVTAMACRTLEDNRPATQPATSDLDLGLRKTALSDDRVPPAYAFPEDGPGGTQRIPPAYPGAPPTIPHSLEGLLPITPEENACVLCHQSGDTGPEDPPQVPRSHLTDFRKAPEVVRDTVAGARWNCTACHVAQSGAPPLVENLFGAQTR